MKIDRADSQKIQEHDRMRILSQFGVSKNELIAIGTEAEVYKRSDTTILKIYSDIERLDYFGVLRRFYENIEENGSEVRLPRILDISLQGNLIAVIETRLEGEPLANYLTTLDSENLYKAETLYIAAVGALKELKLKEQPKTYLLFDKSGRSNVQKQSFEEFYSDLLDEKLAKVSNIFGLLNNKFLDLSAKLVDSIREMPSSDLSIVHGDFFPGNVLVNEQVDAITGIVDFGSFTMFGNHLLDLAGAFSFYQMYNPERKAIRKRMLPRVLDRISQNEEKRFFQFVLSNAILTSDLYIIEENPLDNGHLQWAAEIISEDEYWNKAL